MSLILQSRKPLLLYSSRQSMRRISMAVNRSDDRPNGMISMEADELWWLFLLQGVAAVFFGIAAIFWPQLTLVTLVFLFSAFILVWGIAEIINGFMSIKRRDTWWLSLIFGLAARRIRWQESQHE